MSEPAPEFLFLEPDLNALDIEIERVRGLIREAKEMGQESTEQSSESWHDNYNFEESQRQLRMYLNMLGGLSKAREHARVVSPPENAEMVDIGCKVRFEQCVVLPDGRMRGSFEDEFAIGSYMVGDELRDLGFISYDTPIGRALIGSRPGDVVQADIGGQVNRFTVLSVEPAFT